MRGEFVDLDGAQLYCFASGTRGASHPVIFVHGFPASSHLWSRCLPLVPPGHRALVLDLLGCGRSGPGGAAQLTLTAHAERLRALMDVMGIAVASLVGHGLGCGIVRELVHWHRARVHCACLVSPVMQEDWPSMPVPRTAVGWAPHLPEGWAGGALRLDLSRGYTDQMTATNSLEQYLRPFAGIRGAHQLREHVRALEVAPAWVESGVVSDPGVPTVIVRGDADPWCSVDGMTRFAAGCPGASVEVLTGVRHFVPEESPERLMEIVRVQLHA